MVVYHSAFVHASVLQSFPSSVASYKKLYKYRVVFLSQDLICPVWQTIGMQITLQCCLCSEYWQAHFAKQFLSWFKHSKTYQTKAGRNCCKPYIFQNRMI